MRRAVGDGLAAHEPLVHDVDRGLVARGIIMHLEGDGPPRPRAAAHLVELEAHERLDERALPGGLGADDDDGRHLEGLAVGVREAVEAVVGFVPVCFGVVVVVEPDGVLTRARGGRGGTDKRSVCCDTGTDKRSRFSVSTASRSASRAPPSTFRARAASGVGRATRARGVRGAAHATAANKLTRAQRARRVSISVCGAVKYCWMRTANSGAQRALRNAPY